MEPLFEMKTVYTRKEHIAFNFAVAKKAKSFPILIVLCVLVFLAGIFLNEPIWIAISVILLIEMPLLTYISARRNYSSNKLIQNAEITCKFYDDRLIEETASGNTTILYNQILKILETKSHFYIMIARNQGISIPKADISEELEAHIKELKRTLKSATRQGA